MAGIAIRCSASFLLLKPPPSIPSSASDLSLSAKSHFPGKLNYFSLNMANFVSSSGGAPGGSPVFLYKYSASEGIPLRCLLEDCRYVIKVPSVIDDKLSEWLSAHQRKERLKWSSVAFFLSNALMWTSPFKALAETCEADTSFFSMPLLLFVALIGATVGGLLARQRRGELKRLNDQLRQINAALRRQAKIESYAPNLSYAPVGTRIAENEVIVDPRKEELITRLKIGKNFLRNQDPEKAFMEFKTALELAQNLRDPIEEKKATRGLGASLQRQGKYREAIKYHSLVLAISDREGEDSGNTEAYGAIADCYTELGDLEQAAKFYDKYISRLEKD